MGVVEYDTIGIEVFTYFFKFLNFAENILDFGVPVGAHFSFLKK